MQNVMVMKQRLLVIAAALVLALAVSTGVADTAHARISHYEQGVCEPIYPGAPTPPRCDPVDPV